MRNSTPSSIGLLPLEGYNYTGSNLTTDTTYRIFQTEESFNRNFTASGSAVTRPGFGGQWVVAILLNTTPATPLRFARAEIAGNAIQVYAQTCSTAECSNNPAFLATVPKVGSAKRVRFFINGQPRNEVNL